MTAPPGNPVGWPVTVTVYGIPNCDTTRKARNWLTDRGVGHVFHDYKTRGIDRKCLLAWSAKVGWERLFNRAGTTFRGLADADKRDVDRKKAIGLMVAHPSLIKRPVVEAGDRLIVGFKPPEYEAAWPLPKGRRRPGGGPGRRLGQD